MAIAICEARIMTSFDTTVSSTHGMRKCGNLITRYC